MQKIDLLIHTKHMYTMNGEGSGYVCGQTVAVDGSKIIDIGDSSCICQRYCAEKEIDARDKLVIPGLIDGHMHTGHGILRGLAQDINNWMMEGMAPFEAVRSSEAKTAGSQLAIAEAIMNGTTTIGDDGSDMEGALKFIEKAGIRGNVSVRVRNALPLAYRQGELYSFDQKMGEKTLQEALDLFERYHNKDGGRIQIRFGPQGADFLDFELLQKVRKIAKEKKSKIHMHLAQGTRESEQMIMRYGERTIPLLDKMGYLDSDFIGIHLTDATEEEVKLVADRKAAMILCSNSIGVIAGRVPPAAEFIRAGGRVGLGTDQAPGNNAHNMFSEMKATSCFNKIKYESSIMMPAWKVFRMATIEGANALGIGDITGSITPGKYADMVLLDLYSPTLAPVYTVPMRNMVPNLVYAARGNEVDTVIAHGKVIVENREPKTFSIRDIIDQVQKFASEIGEKASKQFEEINGRNAEYMREGKL